MRTQPEERSTVMVSHLAPGVDELGTQSPPEFDVDAYLALYERANRSRSAFEHDVIDEALDDLTARPDRRASGRRLAANLRRTARKRLLDRRRPIVSSEVVESAQGTANPIVSADIISARAVTAAGLVARAVDALPLRSRRAVHLSLTRMPRIACRVLGIRERQLRSIVSTARSQINHDAGAVAGLGILQEMFTTDRWAPAQAISSIFGKLGVSRG